MVRVGRRGARHVRAHGAAVTVCLVLVLDAKLGAEERRGEPGHVARGEDVVRATRPPELVDDDAVRDRRARPPLRARWPGSMPSPATTPSASSVGPLSSRTASFEPSTLDGRHALAREHLDAVPAVELVHRLARARPGRPGPRSRPRERRASPRSPQNASPAATSEPMNPPPRTTNDAPPLGKRTQPAVVGDRAEIHDVPALVAG